MYDIIKSYESQVCMTVVKVYYIIKSDKSQFCTTIQHKCITSSNLTNHKSVRLCHTRSLPLHTPTHTHTNTLTYHLQCLLYATGWRVPIGCLKLNVIFRNRATNNRPLLPKMTYKDKASYGSSPPCNYCLNIIHVCMCQKRSRKYQHNP